MQTLRERKTDVSIIVPVYNLEDFLSPLLKSLKEQDTHGLQVEYIFVLNNCTDNSEKVIRESRLPCTIINCEIQGCGAARNAGLDIAKGEYIWFLDGDDWLISKTAIYDAVTMMRSKDLDLLRIPFRSDQFPGNYYSMVWQYVYRRDFIGQLRFVNVQPGEDNLWTDALLAKAEYSRDTFLSVPHLTRPAYFYNYMRVGSNMYRLNVLKENIGESMADYLKRQPKETAPKKKRTKKNKGIRYMIHACPARMWYVNDFLIPQLYSQGVKEKEVMVWCDTEGNGILKQFISSMEYCKDLPEDESVWHIQDDALLSSHFVETTKDVNMIASAFCNTQFNKNCYTKSGEVPVEESWTSFVCICIPNDIAAKFLKWYKKETAPGHFRLMPWTETGRCDDTIFHIYLQEKKPVEKVLNIRPNIAEHVDWIVGGSTHSGRAERRMANYWQEWNLTNELEQKVLEYKRNESDGKGTV